MVKNYLPNIPITIPGSIYIFDLKEPLKIKDHNNRKNHHKQIYFKRMRLKVLHIMINRNYMRN